jgi:peptidoglycan hydrolase-like protein with peptidoglycan-binding domain
MKILKAACLAGFVLSTVVATASADDLTRRIQKDLVALGYDPGNISGEVSTDTTVAIAKYQAEHDMPVTGEVSPLLAGILSAEVDKQRSGQAVPAATPAAPDPQALQAAQQACLQDKVAAAQASQKKKRGFGHLMSAITRTASRTGNYDLASTAGDVYSAGATVDDLSAAAKDLGLTEDDVEACRNPTSR